MGEDAQDAHDVFVGGVAFEEFGDLGDFGAEAFFDGGFCGLFCASFACGCADIEVDGGEGAGGDVVGDVFEFVAEEGEAFAGGFVDGTGADDDGVTEGSALGTGGLHECRKLFVNLYLCERSARVGKACVSGRGDGATAEAALQKGFDDADIARRDDARLHAFGDELEDCCGVTSVGFDGLEDLVELERLRGGGFGLERRFVFVFALLFAFVVCDVLVDVVGVVLVSGE